MTNWAWPEANDPVVWDGTFVGEHPTRYTWREDVEALARRMVNEYGCWANTYVDHPPLWGLDAVSVDFWAYTGRGWPIGHDLGQQVFDFIFNDPNPPWIRWCIWEGWIWVDSVGWYQFPDDGTGLHFDHIHMTFH